MKFIEPKRLAEANIQAEIYSRCKALGIQCYLEYKTVDCRFDVIIIKGGEITHIIECKSYARNNPKKENTKQIEKYKKFEVPILLCGRWDDIDQIISTISN